MKDVISKFKSIYDHNLKNALLMGFASGFPFNLIKGTLKLWLKSAGISTKEVTFFSWIGIPYSLKFLWAPLLDRFFFRNFGRRRTWLVATQLILAIFFFLISFANPAQSLTWIVICGIIIATTSATQDIAIDAYRRDSLSDEQLKIGSSLYVYGYRLALWLTRTIPVLIAAYFSWNLAYQCMAVIMLFNLCISYKASEPKITSEPLNLKDTVVVPLRDFLLRNGTKKTILILTFVFLFKAGDSIASAIFTPFYVDIGFSQKMIALIDGNIGFFSTLGGLLLGSMIMLTMNLSKAILLFGSLQIISTVFFVILNNYPNAYMFSFTVFFENITSAMGTAAFSTFIALQTNKQYSATQYSLLTAIMSIPLQFLGGFSGILATDFGYDYFFLFCSLAGLPGLAVFFLLKSLEKEAES